MISIRLSRFYVDCDEDYNAHVFVRTSKELKEITNEMTIDDKNELITDLVYAISELLKERDRKECIMLDKIRAEITSKDGLEEALDIIDKYKEESGV